MRADARVRTERHLYSSAQSPREIAPLNLAQVAVVLQKIRGRLVGFAGVLNALLIVDIHVEISAVLLREGDPFIVNHGGVLYGSDAGPNGVLDAISGVSVSLNAKAEVASFVHRRLQFLRGELDRFRIAAVSEHGACGKNFDVVGAAVRELTDFLPDFPRAIGFTIAKIQRKRNVPCQPGHRSGTPADGDVGASHKHARTDDVTARDSVTHGHIVESAIDADVAHGGEAGKKCQAGVWDSCVGSFGRGPLQDMERLAVPCVGEVRVAIDQSWQYGHFGEIDKRTPVGNG